MLDLKSKYPDFYRFYGRRVAKKLSDKSIESINYYFKSSSFDEEVINSYNEKRLLKIDKKFQKISLEVGFGNGEFLINQSNLNKDSFFIGCEVYLNGFSKVLNKINDRQIKNIKICSINFIYLVQVLKNETIDQIYFINPDPWPKARHNKRRVINIENLNLMASKLKKNCSIIVTTDSLNYYEYIVSIFKGKDLSYHKMEHEELKTTDQLYDISSYQRKAINRNAKIYKVEIFK